MSKRPLSPGASGPPLKRLHHEVARPEPRLILNFDSSLYDELVVHIFSYLTAVELCTVHTCNRHWARLAQDNQLWKALFIREFGTRLRGKGANPPQHDRHTKPLPTRAPQHKEVDWKWMYRISSNWRTGKHDLDLLLPAPTILAGDLTFTAPSQLSREPKVQVHKRSRESLSLRSRIFPSGANVMITCMAIDQSSAVTNQTRVVVFYSTGAFSTFSVATSGTELEVYIPPTPGERTSPIQQAAYHHPFLVTLSATSTLSLYDIIPGKIKHRQTLSSFSSYPPNSLVLSSPSQNSFRLLLSYSTPVYPAHWSVGMVELMISATSSTVSSSRNIRAFELPFTWLSGESMQASVDQWNRKLRHVVATDTDGKWVVIAGADNNNIQVYRLRTKTSPGSLTFVRTLHGHADRLASLSVADGRCVSLGDGGEVWIWDLERGWGVQVGGQLVRSGSRSHVVFDDRRILCIGSRGVEERRFDI
ncbi:hypothetical protein SISNIDRAFT_404077 [Sistotremastrum niveocremeum HHB9708]|uniref:F-box domain-containing protein n=1 Tax=Sistotremastrum niveocremeum HHB9708 TaxID=1314777 RepID=A0A165A7M9_9AGAM|nr:hypothetical protein SISNIDRAFT_404077 [Sistotremastrum niveocremeum HHB9708]